ncbi:transposase [Streptomyces sp. NPDC007929]|uniref:IS110 family transposase n=1 Tax=Streptomyces sp. NPDC007929 TaxID=3364795 RepID=UPI0036E38DAB
MRRITGLYPCKVKTDPRDAFLIANAARAMPQALRALKLEDDEATDRQDPDHMRSNRAADI